MLKADMTLLEFRQSLDNQCSELRGQLRTLLDTAGSLNTISQIRPRLLLNRLDEIGAAINLLNNYTILIDWYITALETFGATVGDYSKSENNNLQLELDILKQTVASLSFDSISVGELTIKLFIEKVRKLLNQDIWTKETQLIVTVGQAFSLRRHYYYSGVRTLSVTPELPNQPWRWSLLVHELGNLLVVPVKRTPPGVLNTIAYQRVLRLNQIKSEIAAQADLFPETLLKAALQGSRDKFDRKAQIDSWIAELFEDAVTVLALGETGFLTLADMLGVNYGSGLIRVGDMLHPPKLLRLQTALKVLQMTNYSPAVSLDDAQERFSKELNALTSSQADFVSGINKIAEGFASAVKKLIDDGRSLINPDELWNKRAAYKGSASQNPYAIIKQAYLQLRNAPPEQIQSWLENLLGTLNGTQASDRPDPEAIAIKVNELRLLLDTPLPRFQSSPESFTQQIEDVVIANYPDITTEADELDADEQGVSRQMVIPSPHQVAEILDHSNPAGILRKLKLEQFYRMVFGIDDPAKCCWGCPRCCCQRTCSGCSAKCTGLNC